MKNANQLSLCSATISYTSPRYVEKLLLNNQRKEHRDRLVALSFVSILLLLIYGPAASWFVGSDRFLYDNLASILPNKALEEAAIVTISPTDKSNQQILDEFGRVLQVLHNQQAERIVMPNPPVIDAQAELPGWAVLLSTGTPVFVPSQHRLADVSANTGILSLPPDNDNILRQSDMWHLQGGIMSPSLPLAVALSDPNYATDPRVAATDVTLYFSNYEPLPRVDAEELLNPQQAVGQLVAQLEEQGILERVPDPADGRAKLVRFSQQGRAGLVVGLAVLNSVMEEAALAVGPERVEAIRPVLQDLVDYFETTADSPNGPAGR